MLARREKRQACREKLGVLEFADRRTTETHRCAGIEQDDESGIGLTEKTLDVSALGARIHVPVDESRIVAFGIGLVLAKLLAEAKKRRAMQAGQKALDDGASDEDEGRGKAAAARPEKAEARAKAGGGEDAESEAEEGGDAEGAADIAAEGGSAGGHNGLKSTIQHLGTQDFARLRIGIGAPGRSSEERRARTVSHVLGSFHQSEQPLLKDVLNEVLHGLDLIQRQGLERAGNRLNGVNLAPAPEECG